MGRFYGVSQAIIDTNCRSFGWVYRGGLYFLLDCLWIAMYAGMEILAGSSTDATDQSS